MTALHELGVDALARTLEAGEASSVDVVEALHARADAVNGQVNAFAHELRERVLAEAKEADEARARGELRGPLHGVPITVKENVDTEGLASTLGMRAREGALASRDAVIVRVAREAGAIVLGKTNVPQTLLSPMETINRLFGTTRNPWSAAHGSGGSSGGEAAAAAAGLSAGGFGTDIGGSIRVPAAFCGVCGLKPTVDRWSNLGSNTAIAGQEVVRAQIGPMGRTVADLVRLMSALDPIAQGRHDPSVPPVSFEAKASGDLQGLRIGYYDDDGWLPAAASLRRAVNQAADVLRDAGAELVPFAPTNAQDVVQTYFAAVSSDGAATLKKSLEGEEPVPPLRTLWKTAKLPGPVRLAAQLALAQSGERRVAAVLSQLGRKPVERLWSITARRSALRLAELASWDEAGIDALLCPPFATTAGPHDCSHDFTAAISYAARYNLLNLPAGAVPVTRVRPDETRRPDPSDRLERRAAEIEAQSEGLPAGVQVVGRPYREDTVLQVMGAIEQGVRGNDDFPRTPVDL